jgi:hypothetical protein
LAVFALSRLGGDRLPQKGRRDILSGTEALLPFIKPGKTERRSEETPGLMDDFGATSQAFTPIVARGEKRRYAPLRRRRGYYQGEGLRSFWISAAVTAATFRI